jgi:3'(2'), 5'-bisphosphate nucleotidase
MLVSSGCNSKLRIVSSRSHPSGDLKILLDRLKEYELVSIGSSLKFCIVAKGEADCYPRLGPTSEWDTAAGEAIASFSGAKIVDLNNQALCYNSRKDFINPHFIVSNNIINKEKIFSVL